MSWCWYGVDCVWPPGCWLVRPRNRRRTRWPRARLKSKYVSCHVFVRRGAQDAELMRPRVDPARGPVIAILAGRRFALAIRVHRRRPGENLFSESAQLLLYLIEQTGEFLAT